MTENKIPGASVGFELGTMNTSTEPKCSRRLVFEAKLADLGLDRCCAFTTSTEPTCSRGGFFYSMVMRERNVSIE